MPHSPHMKRLPLSVPLRELVLAAAVLVTASNGRAMAPQAAKPAPPPVAPAPARPRMPVQAATLSNGLHILCRANESTEMISVVCLVRAGLPDEREEQAGLAALTAEAMLKGTTTHPGSSFGGEVVRAGGNLRAQPGFDFTELSAVMVQEQFEPALKLLADILAHPRFSPEDINEARETLKRRALALQDDFTGASYQTLTSQLYGRSPYGRPINGYAESLDRLTVADVRKFWESHYVQNRMWVAIAGNIDAARSLTLAQKHFQEIPWNPTALTDAPATETLLRPKVETIQRAGPAAQLMVGFLAPRATRANYPVYALLDAVVGGGKRARLFSNIREKHNLGYELGSFYQPLLFQSHLVGYVVTPAYRANPRKEEPESVIDLVKSQLLDQYRQAALTGITDQELVRAKAYVIGRYALKQERTRDQAKWLAWNEAMGLGRDFDQQFATLVQAVTKEQIQEAAKKSLGGYALVLTIPEGS